VFLLWPDTPRVHKRRLRWKAAVHAQPEATVRGARSRRVSLLPVVPPIRRGSVGVPLAVTTPGPGLPPQEPFVVASPMAKATHVDVGRASAPWATSSVPVLSEVAARRAPASAVALRTPRALRRLFARPLGPPFLSDRSPESDLVLLLSSATMGAVARAEQALRAHGLEGEAAQLVARVGELASGRAPVAGFWGDEPCVDALRLRLARSGTADDIVARIGFEGFYAWAGPRIGPEELGRMPPDLVPDAAAAVAATSGYRRAFELVAVRAASSLPGDEALHASRLLALRCALGGTFFPSLVRFLIPPIGERLDRPSPEAWEPALLALHAYRLAGHEAGTTHVAAAVVATVVRDQIARMARRSQPDYRPREWGAPPPTREMDAEHRQMVALVGVLLTQLWWTYERPWPEGWAAPDPVKVERRVSKVLGASGGPAYDVFLDDSLAVAACHALLGHTPSARATLAASRTPDAFVPARDRLSRALERGAFDGNPSPVVDTALARDFLGRLERLRNTPDPAEFGSPDWRRPDLRGRLLSRLQERGPRGLALALRTVLGKGFDELDRFWLAPIAPRRAAVAALAVWLDRQAPVMPTDRDFVLFLEDRCRELRA
jgi:hypothetical protein